MRLTNLGKNVRDADEMSDAIILLGILIIPLLFGRLMTNFWAAVGTSTVLLSILLHAATWLSLGYVAPFASISISVSLVAFFVWAMGLIWLFRRPWTTKKDGTPQQD
jgi:hypothetical protein